MSENIRSNALNAPKPAFSQDDLERLFFWARDRVTAAVASTPKPSKEALGNIGSQAVLGAFVSFKKHGRLRSCMGYLSDGVQLGEALDSSAVTAALQDPRFPPISASEFYDLDLEIWALGSLRRVLEKGEARRDSFKIGRDGLQIVGRGRHGLLLPSVPVELGWNPEQFLDGLCDKAGLARGAWKSDDVQLSAFEGVSFKKPFVWHISKNPELKKIVEGFHDSPKEASPHTSRSTFSFAPGFFEWQAPPTRRSENDSDESTQTRAPAVAGIFYPSTTREQSVALDELKNGISVPQTKRRVAAAMVPHAGWRYSAKLAVETMFQIEPPETVVVLAPKHRHEGANLAVMPYGSWDYGGGTLPNNLEFVEAFVKALPEFKKDQLAHRAEHSIEVQLPLIAELFPKVSVVGILIGRATQNELDSIAERFATFLKARDSQGKPKPLLLISSDMNHYADDATTRVIDKMATDALETVEPSELLRVVLGRRISMCGILPTYLTLMTLKKKGELSEAIRVGYATSGDAGGDRERVVGYAGYLFR